MKWFNSITITTAFLLIAIGVVIQITNGNPIYMARCYGVGTALIFLFWMPVFLIHRMQKTKLLDHLDKKNQKEEQSKEE